MTKINRAQYKIYQTAKRKNNKIKLKEKHLIKLEHEVEEYIDDVVSYSNDEDRTHLIEIMTFGLIDEVVNTLKEELYTNMMTEIDYLSDNSNLLPIG